MVDEASSFHSKDNRMKNFISLWDKHRECFSKILVSLFVSVHASIIVSPILGSAFSADDTFDSMVPMQLKYSGQSKWSFISDYTTNWSRNEGRFFPVSAVIGFFSHYLFPGRAEYKIVQFIFVLTALFVFGLFVKVLFNNFYVGAVAVVLVGTCLQMRVQYDALFQFSLQQPSLVIMYFGSLTFFVLGIRSNNYYKILFSGFLYLLVLLTYETTVLLWPIFILLLLIERPKKYWLTGLIMASFPTAVVLNLLRLRSNVVTTTDGYTSNFEFGSVFRTFAKQAVGSLPISYSEIRPPGFIQSFPAHLNPGSLSWLIAVGSSIFVLIFARSRLETNTHRFNLLLFVVGCYIWLAPALVVAQTLRWQQELTWGNSYITSFQGSFGVVLAILGLYFEIRLLTHKRAPKVFKLAFVLSAVFAATATSSVVANNSQAVAQYNPGYLWPRETFEDSIQNGVFDLVPANSKVLSLGTEWWFNAPFVQWWGGPKLASVVSSMNTAEWSECISDSETCLTRIGYSHVLATFGRVASEPRVVMVGKAVKITGRDGLIKGIRLNSPRIFIDYPTKSNSLFESKNRCLGWGKDRVGHVNGAVDDADVTVLKFNKSSCLLGFSNKISFNPYQFTSS